MFLVGWMSMLAHADAIGPDAEGCPTGARGTANHNGSFCIPEPTCDAGCDADRSCERTSLCILEEERPCGGMTTPGTECTYTHVEVTDTCSADGACAVGECVVADRCVEPSFGPRCATGVGPAGAFSLAMLLPLLARRRKALAGCG
ncbi:MAG: hypothetical protein KTR31_42020 [Myxococcales bacterium]|nr:hypothetical protein [Myxococcales bacterium]